MSDLNRTQMLSGDPNRTQLGMPPVAFDPNRTVMGTTPTMTVTAIAKPTQCTVCKTFNPAGIMYCTDCGLVFEKSLPDDVFGGPKIDLPRLVESGGSEHVIRPGETTIGREGIVALADNRVSRRHARITMTAGVLVLEDLGSSNGTKVDGTRLAEGERRELKGGERISFGGVEVTLAMPGAPGANATQAIPSNRTQAISAAPRKDGAVARLVGGGSDFPLRAGGNTFGRRDGNDIVISDGYVSGKHGLIEVDDADVYVTDTGSTNGTVVGGVKITAGSRTKLHPGDEIRLGSLVLTVLRE